MSKSNRLREDEMQITGMLHGAKLLQFAGFPTSEVLGPDASEEEIRALIDDAFRAALGSAAQLKAQDYSWEETGRRFADTLDAMGEVPSLGNQMV